MASCLIKNNRKAEYLHLTDMWIIKIIRVDDQEICQNSQRSETAPLRISMTAQNHCWRKMRLCRRTQFSWLFTYIFSLPTRVNDFVVERFLFREFQKIKIICKSLASPRNSLNFFDRLKVKRLLLIKELLSDFFSPPSWVYGLCM